MNRRALVTGATGFVGRHLLKHLQQAGWLVKVIVRPDSDCSVLNRLSKPVDHYTHSGSVESMQAILTEARPDVVFHLASLFISEHQASDIERLIQSNLLFGTQLIEAVTQSGTMLLVNAGTSWQHYHSQGYHPVNLYAATKQAFEALLQYYIDVRGLRVITLKLYDTYGPDDPRSKLFNLLKQIVNEKQTLSMSPGEQLIDLVHVDDVARAFHIAAERLLSGQVNSHEDYAISSGQPIRLRDLVRCVERFIGQDLPVKWNDRPYRNREVMKPWVGVQLPGWSPDISLANGIAHVFHSVDASGPVTAA